MALTVVALGLWYALARGRRRAGAVIAGAGLVWTAVALAVVVPAFLGGESLFYGDYEQVGGSPAGVLRIPAATDPLAIVSAVTHGNDVLYVVLPSVPLGGLFVPSPGLALVALPQLAANLLAGREHVTDPHVGLTWPGSFPSSSRPLRSASGGCLTPAASRPSQSPSRCRRRSALHWGRGRDQVPGASDWDTLGTLDTSADRIGAPQQMRLGLRGRRGGRQHHQPSGIAPLRQALRL